MFKNDYYNSVILLGPKGVGKSLISNTLAEKVGINKVVSTDFLRSVLLMYNSGELQNFKEFKEYTEHIAKTKRINPAAQNKEQLLKIQQCDIDDYFKNLYNTMYILGAFKQNKKIDELVHKIFTVQQAQHEHKIFGDNCYKFLMQYFLLEFVDMFLTKINEPIILDMGADLGVKYKLSFADIADLSKLFKSNLNQVLNKQKNLIEKFKIRVALVPGLKYYKSADPKVSDMQNKEFLNRIDDYVDFSNIMAMADGFSYNIADPVYKTYGHFFTYEDIIRDTLKDKGEINNLCDQINELIKQYNEGEQQNKLHR